MYNQSEAVVNEINVCYIIVIRAHEFIMNHKSDYNLKQTAEFRGTPLTLTF